LEWKYITKREKGPTRQDPDGKGRQGQMHTIRKIRLNHEQKGGKKKRPTHKRLESADKKTSNAIQKNPRVKKA